MTDPYSTTLNQFKFQTQTLIQINPNFNAEKNEKIIKIEIMIYEYTQK
jgi:hypothetical protein